MTFTANNWSTAQTVTVTGVNDNIQNATNRSAEITFTPSGADYAGVSAATADFTAVDDDTPGVVVSKSSVSVAEAAGTASYTLVLATIPTGNVTVTPASSDSTSATVSGKVTFTKTDWSTAQTVTVTGVDDDIHNSSSRSAKISHTVAGADYGDVEAADVSVTVTNDDTRGITASPAEASALENGGTASYTVALESEPTGNVTVTPKSADTSIATVSSALTFTAKNWSTTQTVTVTAVNDSISNVPDRTAKISFRPSGADYGSVADAVSDFTALDDESRGLTISESGVTVAEDGGTATYTIVLTRKPSGDVTVTPESADTDVSTVSDALTFTTENWSTKQTVTVTGVNDDIDNASDRTAKVNHTIAGSDYEGLTADSVAVTATDDDQRGLSVSASTVTVEEDGGQAAYTLVLLSEPTSTVTVTPGSADTSVSTVSGALTFTTSNWSSPQTVTVTGVDDEVRNASDRTADISHQLAGGDYEGLAADSVTVTATDDDVRGFTVSPARAMAPENGGTASYSVVLKSQPTGTVTINPSSLDTTIATVADTVQFTESDWSSPQSITVTAVDDKIVNDLTRTARIRFRPSGADYASVPSKYADFTAVDDEAEAVIVTPLSVSVDENGGTATYTVALSTKPTGDVTVTPSSADTSVATTSGALTFTVSAWSSVQTVTVTGVDDQVSNAPDRSTGINHTASGGGYDDVTVEGVTVTAIDDEDPGDIETPRVTLSVSPSAVGEGVSSSTLTVTAALAGGQALATATNLTVSVGGASDSAKSGVDYKAVSDFTLTIPANASSGTGTFTLEPVDDQLIEGNEQFTVAGAAAGVTVQPTSVTLVDDDKGVTVQPTTLTILEGLTDTYTISLSAPPSGDVTVTVSVPAGDVSVQTSSLTFTTVNWATSQTVTVKTVADADQVEDPAVTLSHSAAGGGYDAVSIASVTVNVSEGLGTPEVSVSDSSGTEGDGPIAFAVQLSEPTKEAVTVEWLTRDGTATSGQDYTLSRATLAFAAGETEKTANVPVLDDQEEEGAETFQMRLVQAENAELPAAQAQAIGTIMDDDGGGDGKKKAHQPRIVLWTDHPGYKSNQSLRLYRDIDPLGDRKEYTVFYYREHIETGERHYFSPGIRSATLRPDVVDEYGFGVGDFPPTRLRRVEKELIWEGAVPDPGLWHFALELRNPGTTQIVNAAYAKFTVAGQGTLLLNRPGVDRRFATDTRWNERHDLLAAAPGDRQSRRHAGDRARDADPSLRPDRRDRGRAGREDRSGRPSRGAGRDDLRPADGRAHPGLLGRACGCSARPRQAALKASRKARARVRRWRTGATRPHDSSGALRYLRVEFAGASADPQAASPAVGLYGVGDGDRHRPCPSACLSGGRHCLPRGHSPLRLLRRERRAPGFAGVVAGLAGLGPAPLCAAGLGGRQRHSRDGRGAGR